MGKRVQIRTFVTFAAIISCFTTRPTSATITIVSELSNATLATINDLPARFIPDRFSFYGIQGYVVYAEPATACTDVKPPPIIPITPYHPTSGVDFPINWILLARRSSDCHFQTKIENAQNAGYNAVIIHNVGSNSTEIMGVDDPTKIIIYATFVGEFDGEVLKNCTYNKACFIRIQDDFSINGYLLPFAIVVGMCFIVMIFFMVRLLWQQVIRWLRERRRSRRRKLPTSALKKLPTQKWTKGDPYETCAVCLDDFVEQDKIRVLPCAHGFHMKCIDPWLTKGRRVCPICKRKVVVADERFRDSDSDTEDESAPLLGTSASINPQTADGEETFVQGNESDEQGHSRQRHPAGRRTFGRQNRSAAVDSDSSSMTSVSSQSGSSTVFGGSEPETRHLSRSVLAEVHHSSEVLRQKIEEMEQNNTRLHQQQDISDNNSVHSTGHHPRSCSGEFHSQDNAVYVPDIEFEESKSYNGEDNVSSRLETVVSVDLVSNNEQVQSAEHANVSNLSSNPIV